MNIQKPSFHEYPDMHVDMKVGDTLEWVQFYQNRKVHFHRKVIAVRGPLVKIRGNGKTHWVNPDTVHVNDDDTVRTD